MRIAILLFLGIILVFYQLERWNDYRVILVVFCKFEHNFKTVNYFSSYYPNIVAATEYFNRHYET